jgi:hypothetical protein
VARAPSADGVPVRTNSFLTDNYVIRARIPSFGTVRAML